MFRSYRQFCKDWRDFKIKLIVIQQVRGGCVIRPYTPLHLYLHDWLCGSGSIKLLNQILVRIHNTAFFQPYINQSCEIFEFHFFHDSNPWSGPLMNKFKCFRILFRFRRDIRSQSCRSQKKISYFINILYFKYFFFFPFKMIVFTHERICSNCA